MASFFLALGRNASATAITWNGLGADNNWSTGGNWTGGVAPGASDDVTFNGTSNKSATWNALGPAAIKSLTVTSAYNTGTLTLARNVTIYGGWSWAGTNFSAATYTITLANTTTATFTPGTVTYYGLTFAPSGSTATLTTSGTATVTGTFTVDTTSGGPALSGGTIRAQGGISCTGTTAIDTTLSTTTVLIAGTGAQALSGVATCDLPNVTINKASGTLSLSGTIISAGSWTQTAGTVSAGTSTVVLSSSAASTFTPGSVNYANLTLAPYVDTATLTVSGTANVTGTLTIATPFQSPVLSGGQINVQGDISCSGASNINVASTTTVVINGTGAQALSGVSTCSLPNVTVNKASGTLSMSGTVVSVGSWTQTAGTVSAGTSTLILSSGNAITFTPGTVSYTNLTLAPIGDTADLTISGTVTLTGALTIYTIYQSPAFIGGTINVGGDVTCSGTTSLDTTNSTTSIVFNGTGAQALTGLSTCALPNVTVNKASGTLSMSGTIVVSGGWTRTAGAISAGTSVLSLNGGNSVTFTPGTASYYSLSVDKSSSTPVVTTSGTATIAGDLTYSGGTANGGTWAVAGNVTTSSANAGGGTTVLDFTGTGDQTFSYTAGTVLPVAVDKATGKVVVSSTMTVPSLTINQGEFRHGAFTLTISGATTIGASGLFSDFATATSTIKFGGNITNNGQVNFNSTAGTCGDTIRVTLQSTVAATPRTWSGTGTASFQDTSVQDQRYSGQTCYNCTNVSGNGTGVWTFSSCPTFIAFDSMRALLNTEGPGVVVEWNALFDPRSLGFDVYRTRSDDSFPIRITPQTLTGTAFGASRSYSVVDAEGRASDAYWIHELKASGLVDHYGPLVPGPVMAPEVNEQLRANGTKEATPSAALPGRQTSASPEGTGGGCHMGAARGRWSSAPGCALFLALTLTQRRLVRRRSK